MQSFLTLCEQSSNPFYVLILKIYGYSSGYHGYGDIPERRAGDPCKQARWDWYITNPKSWDVFKDKQILLIDSSGGSFHERWCNLKVYAILNVDDYAKLEELEPSIYGRERSNGEDEEHKFVFRNFQQMVRDINAYKEIGNTDDSGDDHESSENYWKRMIASKTMGMKRKWEGD